MQAGLVKQTTGINRAVKLSSLHWCSTDHHLSEWFDE